MTSALIGMTSNVIQVQILITSKITTKLHLPFQFLTNFCSSPFHPNHQNASSLQGAPEGKQRSQFLVLKLNQLNQLKI